MKNKFYLLVALIIALTLSGGIYAYTFSTATETIAIAQPTGDIATVNATPTQPDWNSILTPVPAMTETLRPNGPGATTTARLSRGKL